MTYNELIEAILGVKGIRLSCNDFSDATCQELSDGEYSCFKCKYDKYGNKEITLGEIYANLSTSDLGKTIIKGILNSMYGRKIGKTYVYADTDSTKLKEQFENASTHAVFPMNPPIEDEWVEVPSGILDGDITHLTAIFDDATVHGLDFKYEKGKCYFKECANVHN